MTLRPLLIALALALPATPVLGDARINYRATEGGGASMQSLLIGHGRIRSDADAQTSVLFDAAGGHMTVIDHGQREYTRIGRAEMEQMGAALGQAMAQMEQALANVPPEMREQMRGMMGGALPGMGGEPMVQMENSGQRDRVAGHACTIYRTRMQGRVVNESCMSSADILADLSAADRATLEAAMRMMQDILEQLASGPLAQFADMTPFRDGLVPLRVTELDGGTRRTSEFAGIDSSALPGDLFEVPAGYREKRLEMPDLSQ